MSSTTVDVVDNKTGPHGGSEPEHAPAAGRFPLRSRWHWRACGQSVRGGVTHALQQAADRSARRARHSRPGRTARLSGPTCARELFPSRTCGAPGGPPAPVRNDADCRADGSQRAVSAPPRAASPRGVKVPCALSQPGSQHGHRARPQPGRQTLVRRRGAHSQGGPVSGLGHAAGAPASVGRHGECLRARLTPQTLTDPSPNTVASEVLGRGVGRRPQRESGGQSAPHPGCAGQNHSVPAAVLPHACDADSGWVSSEL